MILQGKLYVEIGGELPCGPRSVAGCRSFPGALTRQGLRAAGSFTVVSLAYGCRRLRDRDGR